jgi:hypothetical protein
MITYSYNTNYNLHFYGFIVLIQLRSFIPVSGVSDDPMKFSRTDHSALFPRNIQFYAIRSSG